MQTTKRAHSEHRSLQRPNCEEMPYLAMLKNPYCSSDGLLIYCGMDYLYRVSVRA